MAIVKMHKVSIMGLEQDKTEILEALMNIGVVDISDISDMALFEEWSDLVYSDHNDEEILELESDIEKVKSALEYLSLYDKRKKSLFEPKRAINLDNYRNIVENKEKLQLVVEKINKADEKLIALKNEENRLNNLVSTLTPWKSMDLPVDYTSTVTTDIILGVMPSSVDTNEMIDEISQEIKECFIQIINTDKDQTYLQVIFHKSKREEVLKFLNRKGFNKITFDLKGTIKENINITFAKTKEIEAEGEVLEKEIAGYVNERDDLEVLYDYLNIQHDRKEILGRLVNTDKVFILDGWVSDNEIEKFKDNVNNKWHWDCMVDIREGTDKDEFPILLENNKFVQSFELVTELYSLPNPNEIDPNPYMAPFFFFVFRINVR